MNNKKNIFTKINKLFLISLSIVLFSLNSFSQEIMEKQYFDANKKIGGDIVIKNSKIKIEGNKTYKIFEIESPDNGNYYMSAWLMGGEKDSIGSGKFIEYELSVNNEKKTEKLKAEKNNWHTSSFKDSKTKEKKTVKLKKGLNQIVFSCDAPEIPEVEFIRLSKDKEKVKIPDEKYVNYVEKVKQKAKEKPVKEGAVDTLANTQKSYTLSNPKGNYEHRMDVDFTYTTLKTTACNYGDNLSVRTWGDASTYVVEVFSYDYPENYSWKALSNSDDEVVMNITIPYTGAYFIRVRSYYLWTSQTVTLRIDDTYHYDCPVAGNAVGYSVRYDHVDYNYFVANLTGDSRIWLEEYDSYNPPGRICAWNDDYNETSDFYWGWASRVKSKETTRAILISAYSSYNPTGNCDVYMLCKDIETLSYAFNDLIWDDGIQSAPVSYYEYNSFSWAGGIVDFEVDPSSPFSDYWAGSVLATLDNFFGSVRYSGAMTYTRSGATSSNSVIDIWGWTDEYVHASVSGDANNHPHGYDYESRPAGYSERFFHPRYSIGGGTAFGSVQKYYKKTSSKKSAMLLDESVARGLSVIENVKLTTEEETIISDLITALTENQRTEFENKYATWKETWQQPEIAMSSNSRMFAKSEEYEDFISYCESQGKEIWPLVFDKFLQGDYYVVNALEDLTLEENQEVLEKVKAENKKKSTNRSGAVIVRSPEAIATKYIKELLKTSNTTTSVEGEDVIYSNSFEFNVYPNPVDPTSQLSFVLSEEASVRSRVIDLNGKVLSVVIDEQPLMAGAYNYKLNIPANFNGTCLVKLVVNNNVNVKLIVVK